MRRPRFALAFGQRRFGAVAIFTVLLALACASARALPVGNDYGFEDDPVRRGNKALDDMNLEVARASFEEAIENQYQLPKADLGLAQVMVYSGDLEAAERLYREAIDASKQAGDKAFPDAHAGLGVLLADADRWPEATTEINIAYEQNHGLWEAVYGRARLRMHEGKWDEAKRLLDYGAGRDGVREGKDLYYRGMALYHIGRHDIKEAEIDALNAFHMNPSDPRHGKLLAHIYEIRNVPALAIQASEEVLATPSFKPSASFLTFVGSQYEKAKRYNEARDRYLQAIAVDSLYAPVYMDLANLYERADQSDLAARVYLKYTELAPDDPAGFVGLVASLNDAGRYGQALKAASRAMEIDSTRADIRLAYARSAIRSRDPGARAHGIEIYATLPDSVSLEAEDHVLIATQQMDEGQLDHARSHLESAISLDPKSAEAQFQMGQLAFKAGHPDSAATRFQEAIRIDSTSPLYYLNLGVARFQMQQMDSALVAFRAAGTLDPRSALPRALLGQAYAAMDSLTAAEAAYQSALDLDPKNGRALRGIGYCRLRADDNQGAVDAYLQATEAEPKSAAGWVGLGQAYLRQQSIDAAESAFRKAQSIDPSNPTAKQAMENIAQARRGGGK